MAKCSLCESHINKAARAFDENDQKFVFEKMNVEVIFTFDLHLKHLNSIY